MNDSLKAQCGAEFLGTGLFLFFGIGCLSALKVAGASLGLWEICIIWGLGISLAVYLTAGISGGHLNPAVTIALWLFACFPKQKVLPYIIAQFAGAFGGALLAYVLYSSLFTEFETAHHMVRGSVESLQLASIFRDLLSRTDQNVSQQWETFDIVIVLFIRARIMLIKSECK